MKFLLGVTHVVENSGIPYPKILFVQMCYLEYLYFISNNLEPSIELLRLEEEAVSIC